MLKNKKLGFTLVELLVVVLIIGILAAIVMPQYQRAVEKSRLSEPMSIMPTISQAVDNWVNLNGGIPQPPKIVYFLGNKSDPKYVPMDIDLDMLSDCRDNGVCNSKRFEYQVVCYSGRCSINVEPLFRGNKEYYIVNMSRFSGSALRAWHKVCTPYGKRGKEVCDYLVNSFGYSRGS